jgi:hypothetical protein
VQRQLRQHAFHQHARLRALLRRGVAEHRRVLVEVRRQRLEPLQPVLVVGDASERQQFGDLVERLRPAARADRVRLRPEAR